jgi:uncharacterized protein (TIGR03083 family)
MADPAVENLEIVWRSIAELCAGLSEEEWGRPTDCPGWSVKDQLSHLVGPEAMFVGRPQPSGVEFRPPHVRNDIGAANEAAVGHRHAWSGADVLAEFEEVIGERITQLQAMDEEDLAEDSWTPVGPGTYRDLLVVRAFDSWVHEQDIRAALERPGHLDGPVAENALARCFLAMPYVVGKKAAAPEGSTVVFDVAGPTSGRLGVVVEGRARAVEPPPEAPAVTVTADFLAFTRLGCGRVAPDAALADARVTVAGDQALGEAIVRHLAFMI